MQKITVRKQYEINNAIIKQNRLLNVLRENAELWGGYYLKAEGTINNKYDRRNNKNYESFHNGESLEGATNDIEGWAKAIKHNLRELETELKHAKRLKKNREFNRKIEAVA